MKILVATGGGEPIFSSNMGLIHGLKSLGHEVASIGPGYWGRNNCDIEVPNREHPERYSYSEVLSKAPWIPDLILQVEPHFFLTGFKPLGIKSAYLFTDAQAGGATWYAMAKEGNFDVVFCAQKYYIPLFQSLPCRVEWLPPGFDERRFVKEDSPNPQVDIAFVGYSGMANIEFPFQDENGPYTTMPSAVHEVGLDRYASKSYTLDYAERAELLLRLCKDFNVRIYGPLWDTPNFAGALQMGAIGFHRSLLHDVAIRIYEIMAAGLFLVTDNVPFLEESIQHPFYRSYDCFYKPFHTNFNLEYQYVRDIVKKALNNPNREVEARNAKEYAWNHHSWVCRASRLLNLL